MWDQRLCSTIGQGCWFDFLPKVGLEDGVSGGPDSLVRLLYGPDDGRLHSVVEWGCRFASLTGWGGRMGSRAGFSPLTGDPNQA